MSLDVLRSLNFNNVARIIGLPDGVDPQEPATIAQLRQAIEGLAWKDTVKVAAPNNINIASPGASIDGQAMSVNDRALLPNQTTASENGIYIWNGPSTAMTRALDANSADDLSQAVVPVELGTSAGTAYRQSATIVTVGTDTITWTSFGSSVPPASTSVEGKIQLATLAEVDTGTNSTKAITPSTLSSSKFASRKYAANFGDTSTTSYDITHNLNSRDVDVTVYRNSGNYDLVLVEVQRPTVNMVRIILDSPPGNNALRVKISD